MGPPPLEPPTISTSPLGRGAAAASNLWFFIVELTAVKLPVAGLNSSAVLSKPLSPMPPAISTSPSARGAAAGNPLTPGGEPAVGVKTEVVGEASATPGSATEVVSASKAHAEANDGA